MVSLVDLVNQASAQSWAGEPGRGSDYRPVTRGDRSNGFFKAQATKAEDGHNAASALWISPRRATNGQIEVRFPPQQVAPNGVFRAQLGFMGTARHSSDGVEYGVRVRFHVGKQAHEATVGFGHKKYTGSLVSLNLDLSPFAGVANGGQLELFLRVGAGDASDNDTLLWINPRIETGEGDPFEFELRLNHFRIMRKNESSDEPTVLVRAAWLEGGRFDVDDLAHASPTIANPSRISMKPNRVPEDRQLHRIKWSAVRPGKLLGAEAQALNRFALIVLMTERDNSDSHERDRAEQLADYLLRLRLRDEVLRLVLAATHNLTRPAPRGSLAEIASTFRVWTYEETWRGYAQTVSVGGDNDDFVGSASFEASLLDLLIAGPQGQLVQLNHQNSGKGRYEMTGRLVMVG